MAKYKIWDKKEDIYTLGRDAATGKMHYTAQEYIDEVAPWAGNPNVKVIVAGGNINGMVFMEYDATIAHYKRNGAPITDNMTVEEILAAIEAFEDAPPPVETVTAEERIAAALEFQNLLSL